MIWVRWLESTSSRVLAKVHMNVVIRGSTIHSSCALIKLKCIYFPLPPQIMEKDIMICVRVITTATRVLRSISSIQMIGESTIHSFCTLL